MMLAPAILGLVTVERIFELGLAQRNTRALLGQGAREVAPTHYGFIVLLHAAWLGGLWLLGWNASVSMAWLAVFASLQVMRLWVLATLGPRWTTRILVLPGKPLVRSGPYRFLRHPNYAVVIGEVAVLPLAFELPAFAALFTILNLWVLSIRVRAEDKALAASAP